MAQTRPSISDDAAIVTRQQWWYLEPKKRPPAPALEQTSSVVADA
jgi:hypothetical protein